MIGSPKSLFRVPKISNRQRRRIADLAIVQAQKVNAILLAVLAQSGGEITVTQGTLDQVGKKFHELDYVIVPGKVKGEHIVRLLEGKTDSEKAVAETETPNEVRIAGIDCAEQSVGEDVI